MYMIRMPGGLIHLHSFETADLAIQWWKSSRDEGSSPRVEIIRVEPIKLSDVFPGSFASDLSENIANASGSRAFIDNLEEGFLDELQTVLRETCDAWMEMRQVDGYGLWRITEVSLVDVSDVAA